MLQSEVSTTLDDHALSVQGVDDSELVDVDLADEMEEAPAEHSNIQPGPGGVEEDDPRPYTTRQKIGLFLGPFLFVLMLVVQAPAGMEPAAQILGHHHDQQVHCHLLARPCRQCSLQRFLYSRQGRDNWHSFHLHRQDNL